MLVGEIAQHLATQGVGTLGTTVFAGIAPEAPDVVVVVQEFSPASAIYTMGQAVGSVTMERARVQVMSRALDYVEAESLASRFHKELDGLKNITISGVRYHYIQGLQSKPFPLSRDANDRFRFAANYEVMRERVST